MPFGYLITTGLMAAGVLFALAPPRPRRSGPFRLSFVLAFAVNELPFFAFYWLVASTAPASPRIQSRRTSRSSIGRLGASWTTRPDRERW